MNKMVKVPLISLRSPKATSCRCGFYSTSPTMLECSNLLASIDGADEGTKLSICKQDKNNQLIHNILTGCKKIPRADYYLIMQLIITLPYIIQCKYNISVMKSKQGLWIFTRSYKPLAILSTDTHKHYWGNFCWSSEKIKGMIRKNRSSFGKHSITLKQFDTIM